MRKSWKNNAAAIPFLYWPKPKVEGHVRVDLFFLNFFNLTNNEIILMIKNKNKTRLIKSNEMLKNLLILIDGFS